MIDASTFLRRALLADALFSGVAALGFTVGAGTFATVFNLPEALLRRQRRLDGRQPRTAVLGHGVTEPCRRTHDHGAGNRDRRIRRAAICGLAKERERSGCLNNNVPPCPAFGRA